MTVLAPEEVTQEQEKEGRELLLAMAEKIHEIWTFLQELKPERIDEMWDLLQEYKPLLEKYRNAANANSLFKARKALKG